jgi:hypothetical protein
MYGIEGAAEELDPGERATRIVHQLLPFEEGIGVRLQDARPETGEEFRHMRGLGVTQHEHRPASTQGDGQCGDQA